MSTVSKYLIAGTIGAAAVLFITPAGATTLVTLGAAGILAGGMIASAHILGNGRNNRGRRNRRPYLRDQESNHLGVRQNGGRRIDPP